MNGLGMRDAFPAQARGRFFPRGGFDSARKGNGLPAFARGTATGYFILSVEWLSYPRMGTSDRGGTGAFRPADVVGLVALLVISFVVFDRFLFLAVRVGTAEYYRSVKTDTMTWGVPYGRGDGTVLVLGTSRSLYGFSDPVISKALGMKVYKDALPGHYPQHNYYFLEKYEEHFGAPNLVVYGLDYFMFEKDSIDLDAVRPRPNPAEGRLDPGAVENLGFRALSRVSWLYRLKPQIDAVLSDILTHGLKTRGEPRRARVFIRRDALGNIREDEDGLPAVSNLTSSRAKHRYTPWPGKEGDYFVRLLERLEREGVRTILVMLPEYIRVYLTNFERDKFRADIRALAAHFRNVSILDVNRPDGFDLEDRSLFWDPDGSRTNSHLAGKGARLLSQKLAEFVLKGPGSEVRRPAIQPEGVRRSE